MGKRRVTRRRTSRVPAKRLKAVSDGVQEETDNAVLLFLMSETGRKIVMAIDTNGPHGLKVTNLNHLASKWRYGSLFTSLGSRIYAIAGEKVVPRFMLDTEFNEMEIDHDPLGMWYCDITRRKGGLICCSDWMEGPKLKAIKPRALVVTLNGKIYVLAGTPLDFFPTTYQNHPDDYFDKILPNPMFEVFDPRAQNGKGQWRSLPAPPYALQLRHYTTQCDYHTVYGNTIVVHILNGHSAGYAPRDALYLFDTVTEEWSAPADSYCLPSFSSAPQDEKDLVTENLSYISWSSGAYIVGNKMLLPNEHWPLIPGEKIFALDFLTRHEHPPDFELEFGEDANYIHAHTFSVSLDFSFQKCSIHGLSHLFNEISPTEFPYITALSNQTYFASALFRKNGKYCLRACTFRLPELQDSSPASLHATDINFCDYQDFYPTLYQRGFHWCKFQIPNLSC